jgi:hypothetical protein
MVRVLIWTPVILIVAAVAGLYFSYGEIEPCRALAVEQARRSVLPTSFAEPLKRAQTAQMSSTACAKDLFLSWKERLNK